MSDKSETQGGPSTGAAGARPEPKKKPEVGAESSDSGWWWKILIGAVVGAIGYKLVDEYWPGDAGSGGDDFGNGVLRVPAGVITGDQYECMLRGDGNIMCVPKASWPANWTQGGEG